MPGAKTNEMTLEKMEERHDTWGAGGRRGRFPERRKKKMHGKP